MRGVGGGRRFAFWGRAHLLLLLLLAATCCAPRADTTHTSTLLYAADNPEPQTLDDLDLADQIAIQTLRGIDSESLFEIDDGAPGDIVARVGGQGRSRSDGVSLLTPSGGPGESTPNINVAFSPAQLDVGWTEACLPTMYSVAAKNLASYPIRIDDVHFESDAFWLASDPRGVMVEPGQGVQLSIIFVASQPRQVQEFIFVATSVGEFAVPVRGFVKLSSYGLRGLRVSMPVGSRVEHTVHMYNPSNDTLRVSEIFSPEGVGDVLLPLEHSHPVTDLSDSSSWELPPLSTKPVARFIFAANGLTGRHRSSMQIETSDRQFVIPIHIDVQRNTFIVEPSEVDVGVFTSVQMRRQILLSFHNMAPDPVTVQEVLVVDSDGLEVAPDHNANQLIVPSQTRVRRTIQIVIRNRGIDYRAGAYVATLRIRTNTTVGEVNHHVSLHGFVMRGHLSYSLPKTMSRVAASTSANTAGSESALLGGFVQIDEGSSYPLVLRNHFDVAVEVERVTFHPWCEDFSVQSFGLGVVHPSAQLPLIWIQTHPIDHSNSKTRACSLLIETNASFHRIPIFLYTGITNLTSSRELSDQVVPANDCEAEMYVDQHDDACSSSVPPEQWSVSPRDRKLCRHVVIDFGKIARFGNLEEFVNITNPNPSNLQVEVLTNTESSKRHFDVTTTVSFNPDMQVLAELAMISEAWRRSFSTREKVVNRTVSITSGETMTLLFRIKFKTKLVGNYLEPILTLESQFETIHIYLRFEVVKGTIKPRLKSIEVPLIHPGRFGYVNIPFTSTLAHDVHSRGVIVGNSKARGRFDPFGLWQLPAIIPANSTTNVTLYYFSNSFYADCKQEGYLADCFVPNKLLRSKTPLSAFGSFVTREDIEQLEIRTREWGSLENDFGEKAGITIALGTDSLQTAAVDIIGYVSRPRFFNSSGDQLTVTFPLTKVLSPALAFIKITNPCDTAIDFELAITPEEEKLFYSCDEDMTEQECLGEWHDIAKERVEHRGRSESLIAMPSLQQVAPLYYKPTVVRIPGLEDGLLGPIHFFPSNTGGLESCIFVRNNLTHIEPVRIVASSGKGSLSVRIPTRHGQNQQEKGKLDMPGAPSRRSIVFALDEEDINSPRLHLTRVIHVTNSGTFNLILSIKLVQDLKAFELSTERDGDAQRSSYHNQQLTLAPNETLVMHIDFLPDCFRAKVQGYLELVTEDEATTLALDGRLSTQAAFYCRRQLLSTPVAAMLKYLWILVSLLASIVATAALWRVGVSRSWQNSSAQIPPRESPGEAVRLEGNAFEADVVDLNHISGQLEYLDQVAETEPCSARITPAVAALLASRKNQTNSAGSSDHNISKGCVPANGGAILSCDREDKCPKVGPEGTFSKSNDDVSQFLARQNTLEAAEIKEDDVSPGFFDPTKSITQDRAERAESVQFQLEETTAEDDESSQRGGDPPPRFPPGEASSDETPLSAAHEENLDDGVITGCAMSAEGPFSPTGRFHDQAVPEFTLDLNFDDDWNTLPFESLHSEIGKLVEDDRTFGVLEHSSARLEQTASAGVLETAHDDATNSQRLGVLNSLSMAPPSMPMTLLFAADGTPPLQADQRPRPSVTRSIPPGFTPADANPEASRVTFERLLRPPPPSPLSDAPPQRLFTPVTNGVSACESAFAASYSLFGLLQGNESSHALSSLQPSSGHIGSSRSTAASNGPRQLEGEVAIGSQGKPSRHNGQLSALGGVELPAGESSSKPKRRRGRNSVAERRTIQ